MFKTLRTVVHTTQIRQYAVKSLSRRERLADGKSRSVQAFQQIAKEYKFLHRGVTKVVDLGYAPGTWFHYTQQVLSALHGIKCEHIYRKCTMIGLDLLYTQPPRGTFSTQGSILSQKAHDNVLQLLKEAAFKSLTVRDSTTTSPLAQEIAEDGLPGIDDQLQELTNVVSRLNLSTDKKADDSRSLYQADLILSDLSVPLLQESGFFNNTQSYPFIRSGRNKALRKNFTHPQKMSIDLTEAALLLCGEALIKGGTFVARLNRVDLADPELDLLESRLNQVFEKVNRWSSDDVTKSSYPRTQDLFFVCQGKRHSTMDKYAVFNVE